MEEAMFFGGYLKTCEQESGRGDRFPCPIPVALSVQSRRLSIWLIAPILRGGVNRTLRISFQETGRKRDVLVNMTMKSAEIENFCVGL